MVVRGKLAPHVALPGVQLSCYIKRTCIFCGAPFGTQFHESSMATINTHRAQTFMVLLYTTGST